MARDDESVLLAVASSELEAQIWRDALEQEGIHPFVRNRAPLAYLGSDALFATYEVFVLARDVKRAQWVIGDEVDPADDSAAGVQQEQASARD